MCVWRKREWWGKREHTKWNNLLINTKQVFMNISFSSVSVKNWLNSVEAWISSQKLMLKLVSQHYTVQITPKANSLAWLLINFAYFWVTLSSGCSAYLSICLHPWQSSSDWWLDSVLRGTLALQKTDLNHLLCWEQILAFKNLDLEYKKIFRSTPMK